MTFDELTEIWSEDTVIDRSDLFNESLRIPKLHSKYYNIYINEKKLLHNLNAKALLLEGVAYEYYEGVLTPEEIKKWGWDGPALRRLSTADGRKRAVETDTKVIELNLKIALQKEKCDFCYSIIHSLRDRNFLIKSAIDYMKFQSGA